MNHILKDLFYVAIITKKDDERLKYLGLIVSLSECNEPNKDNILTRYQARELK